MSARTKPTNSSHASPQVVTIPTKISAYPRTPRIFASLILGMEKSLRFGHLSIGCATFRALVQEERDYVDDFESLVDGRYRQDQGNQ